MRNLVIAVQLGVVSENHIERADRVPVSVLVIGEPQELVRLLDLDRLEIAVVHEFKGIGRLGDKEHIAAKHARLVRTHLSRELRLQRAGAAVEEFHVKIRELLRVFKCPHTTISFVFRVTLHVVIYGFGTIIEAHTHKGNKNHKLIICRKKCAPYSKYKAHNDSVKFLDSRIVFEYVN